MPKRYLLTTIPLFFLFLSVFSQRGYVQIDGIAEYMLEPLPGAKVTLFKNNVKQASLETEEWGRFRFKLDFNNTYNILVEKDIYVSKNIEINTAVPGYVKGVYISGFAIGLLDPCEGVDYSLLKQPVDHIYYSERKDIFRSDKKYVYEIQEPMEALVWEIQQCLRDKYDEIIREADALYDSKTYRESRNKYRLATQADPYDRYPQRMIKQIDDLLADREATAKAYAEASKTADDYFGENELKDAAKYYEKALDARPDDDYARERLDFINEKLYSEEDLEKQARANERKYANIIFRADGAFKSYNYDLAKELYSEALRLMPDEQLPKERLAEIAAQSEEKETAITVQSEPIKQETLKEQPTEPVNGKSLDDYLKQADNFQANEELSKALAAYREALALDPGSEYIKSRISRVERKLEKQQGGNEADRAVEQAFTAALYNAENLMREGKYSEAIATYNRAGEIKPKDKDVSRKIALAEQKAEAEKRRLASEKEQAQKDQVNKLLAEADALKGQNKTEPALSKYREALAVNPGSDYIKRKIADVEKALAEERSVQAESQQTEKLFREALSKAESFEAQGDLTATKAALEKALTYKPDDFGTGNKLAAVRQKIDAQEQARAQQAQNEKAIRDKINRADELMAENKLDEAMNLYREVQKDTPGNQHIKNQIASINNTKARKQADRAKQEELDRRYDETIKSAARLTEEGDYAKAIDEYERAKVYRPAAEFPFTKIAELKELIAGKQQREAMMAMQRQQYRSAITTADRLFTEKKYTQAKQAYLEAKKLSPAESYPDAQITKVNQALQARQLAAQRDRDKAEKYKQTVSDADALYMQKKYAQAKSAYQQALQLNDVDTYPKQQIAAIDKLLTKQSFDKKKAEELKRSYDAAIAAADKFFNGNSLSAARSEYEKALRYLPDESYPKQRIQQIEEKLSLLAEQQKQKAETKTTVKPKGSGKTIDKLYFSNSSEKKKYMEALKANYKPGVTKEIYRDKRKTTERFIIIRNNEVNEFRRVKYSWGTEMYHFDTQTTALYFNQQVKTKPGEAYFEIEM